MKNAAWVFIAGLLFVLPLHARYFEFQDLRAKELDEMEALVKVHTRKAREALAMDLDDEEMAKKEQDAVEELRTALVIILSRPDNDKMVQTLIESPRTELRRLKSFEESLLAIAGSAIRMAKDKALTASQRATQLFVLQNIMTQTRSDLVANETIQRMFRDIQDASLEPDRDVQRVLQRAAMRPPLVSKIAQEVLKKDLKGKSHKK
jgi:hypothetical protein